MRLFSSNKVSNSLINFAYSVGFITTGIIGIFLIQKSLPINIKEQQEYQRSIEEREKSLSQLKYKIIELEYSNSLANVPLKIHLSQLEEVQIKLQNIPSFFDKKQKTIIRESIEQNDISLEKAKEAWGEIQKNKIIIRDSCDRLKFLGRELSVDSENINSLLLENIKQQFDNLFDYCLQSNNLNFEIGDTAGNDILDKIFQDNLTQGYSFLIKDFIEISQNITESQAKNNKILIDLKTEIKSSEEKNLSSIYELQYKKSLQSLSRYRLSLYVSFCFLLILGAYQIIKSLSNTNKTIIKTLEGFTEELESKVEQRTAQLEESIKKTEGALAQAQNANAAKSRFLANMSHELRTPLNAILGFTQLMCRDMTIDIGHRENLSIINRSGEHLLKLINDILEMSKIEIGQTQLNEEIFDLDAMLQSLEDMLRLKAEAKNLDLIFHKDSNIPQFVKADEGKLRQIVINLLGNALKFTQSGSVTLNLKLKNLDNLDNNQFDFVLDSIHKLHFAIEDTGPGIAAEEMNKLFTPFEQTKVGRQSQEGTGLGLSICKKFVELMGGELSVESTVGQGTIFAFDILIQQVEECELNLNKHQERKILSLAPSTKKYRILAVDDVKASRILLNKMLSSIGFEIKEAADGQEAIEVWNTWNPHLILMDMRMPIIDGYEATKRIKSQQKGEKTVIIALTASAFEEEKLLILAAGCDDFMRKPFYEQELLSKIGEHLQVEYLYQDETAAKSQHSSDTPAGVIREIRREDLAVMSDIWRSQLCRAALEVNDREIFRLLAEIPSEYESLAKDLRLLVEEFRCDKIIDLTESI